MARGPVTSEARERVAGIAARAAAKIRGFGRIKPPEHRPANPPAEAIVVMPARGEILFRLVAAGEPKRRDFESKHDRGQPAMGAAHVVHCGLSMFERPEQALSNANRYPLVVAAVTLAENAGLSLAKTFGTGHYTVWGQADALLARATPVAREVERH